MGKKLAIKGHPTRGKEVIKLLEMMGGINNEGYIGTNTWKDEYYFLDNGYIHAYDWCDGIKFTLEEFLMKYPFYNGDKVFDIADGDPGIITAMKWDEDVSDMKYHVAFDNGDMGWYTNDMIEFLKKDNKEMNGNIETNHSKVNGLKRGDEYPIMEGVECNECIKYYFPDGYEFVDTDDTGVYLKPIKPKYPKTYKECCDVLGVTVENLSNFIFKDFCLTVTHTFSNSNEYYINLFKNFFELKLCYDAYRKIAGEQMGLGKPWEPDWSTENERKYVIEVYRNNVRKNSQGYSNTLLAFPTEEMRDTFYKNFKDLIEECKELL